MKLACPRCNAKILLSEAELTGVMVEMVEVAARIGAHWDLVSEYVDCFRIDTEGYVNTKRRVRILKEIAGLIEAGEFNLDRKKYRVDVNGIRWGMRIVCDLQKTGFRNHNYLKKVMINSCGAERLSAEGMTAKEEEKREYERRTSNVQRPTSNSESRMTFSEWLERRTPLDPTTGAS